MPSDDNLDVTLNTKALTPGGWSSATLDQRFLQRRLGYHIRQIENFKNALLEPLFDQHGIRPVDYCILALLETNDGVTQTAIADTLHVQRTNLVRSMSRLEGLNYVGRATDESDKRNQFLVLTKAGREALARLDAELEAYESAWTADLTEAEVALLGKLMQRLYDR
ncbi:MarR family winged helix-turn-helix transcriptional regulator [Paraburkholderia heleia]|uniref:MarR family winged helix-turn-helix transcriptional regulator n=1 Tax=Paraburkholderia heleia TaxID=634127 RepID=UPI0005A9789A|nr:MarR family winged helix-turn-helix transcriptional regulator [Paraburkholderia heleia]